MAVNHKSGRLVVDIEPELKLALHAALAADGLSLKDWVTRQAREFIDARVQPRLSAAEPSAPTCRDK